MNSTKLILILLFVFSLFATSSCGEADEDLNTVDGLEISVSSPAVLIPADVSAISNCGLAASANRFALRNFRINWSRFGQDLTIVYVKVTIQSSQTGDYSALVADEALDDILVYQDTSTEPDGQLTRLNQATVPAPVVQAAEGTQQEAVQVSVRSGCTFHMGGVNIENTDLNFEAFAQVELLAIAAPNQAGIDAGLFAAGVEEPIKLTRNFEVTYDLN